MARHRQARHGGVFLAGEVLFFGDLFLAYLCGRTHRPQGWAVASRPTDVTLGTVNTALLLTSSAVAVLAVACQEQARQRCSTARPLALAATLTRSLTPSKAQRPQPLLPQQAAPQPR